MSRISSLKNTLILLLCLIFGLSCAILFSPDAEAAEAAMSVSSERNNSTVTVTVSFPDISFAAATIDVAFNSAHIQLAEKPTSTGLTHPMITISEAAASNTKGKCTFAIMNMADTSAKGGTLNLKFTVKDTSVEETSVTVTVVNCGNASAQAIALKGATKTVTLKTPEPPPVTDTSTNTSTSTSTTTDTSTSTSTTTKPPVTDDPKPTTSSSKPTTTTSSKPSTTTSSKPVSSNKPSSDPSITTDSATETDIGSITDTPIDTETSVTEPTVSTTVPGPTIIGSEILTATSSSEPAEENSPISTTVVAMISVGIASFLCGGLTVLGLMRHKKED